MSTNTFTLCKMYTCTYMHNYNKFIACFNLGVLTFESSWSMYELHRDIESP